MLVRPSRRVFEAAVTARLPVSFFGAFVCDRALLAADLDALPVDLLVKVFDALEAAFFPVVFLWAMIRSFRLGLLHSEPER